MNESVQVKLLNGFVQVVIDNTIASNQSSDNNWNHVVVTFENNTQTSLNILVYINDSQVGTTLVIPSSFPTALQSAIAGNGYTGLLQDVGIYSPSLSQNDLTPDHDDFITQCLCYPDAISATDRSLCNGTTPQNRYTLPINQVDSSALMLF